MQKWEYKVVYHLGHGTEVREKRLNELGAQGRLLVCVDSYDNAYFKRPKS